jgi:hypothetical protein
MGIPQVPGYIGRAPLLALRAVFTGIGRALMVADRPAVVAAPAADNGRAPTTTPPVTDTGISVTAPGTDNGRAPTTTPPIADTGISAAAAGNEGETESAARNVSAAGLPLPNYDTLSLPSIRARLRGLDVAQLKVLLDYEAANAERAEVLGMFERRIEKLEAGT